MLIFQNFQCQTNTLKENNHQRKFKTIFCGCRDKIKRKASSSIFFLNDKVDYTQIQTQYGNTIYSAHENGNVWQSFDKNESIQH